MNYNILPQQDSCSLEKRERIHCVKNNKVIIWLILKDAFLDLMKNRRYPKEYYKGLPETAGSQGSRKTAQVCLPVHRWQLAQLPAVDYGKKPPQFSSFSKW